MRLSELMLVNFFNNIFGHFLSLVMVCTFTNRTLLVIHYICHFSHFFQLPSQQVQKLGHDTSIDGFVKVTEVKAPRVDVQRDHDRPRREQRGGGEAVQGDHKRDNVTFWGQATRVTSYPF